MALLELFQSFADLWTHFDSVEAAAHGPGYPPPTLDSFDPESGRQHAAAFRSLAIAIEDLEPDSLDEEIDRTLLLNAVRVRLRRLEKERQERVNPAIWTDRLVAALEARPGEADLLARIPAWVASARDTIVKPPLVHLEVALAHLAEARGQLQSESWWQSDKEALSRANAALEVLEGFFRHEVEPDPAADAGALGRDAIDWRIQNEHLSIHSTAEVTRRVAARVGLLDQRAGGADVAIDGLVDAYADRMRGVPFGDGGSEIRRRLVPPAWAKAWASFVLSNRDDEETVAVAVAYAAGQARLGALDLGLQLGSLAPTEAVNEMIRLGVTEPASLGTIGDLLVWPLAETGITLLGEEWEALRDRWPGGAVDLIDSVVAQGLFHPTLAAWRLGNGG